MPFLRIISSPSLHKSSWKKNDDACGDYEIVVETVDEHIQPAQVLSDGTLRLLALAAIRNDPQYHGVLCLEEPENGVHPLHLHEMARILREMATDFHDPRQVNESLKQVLITTHSPIFISQPEIIDALLLVITPRRVRYHNIPSVRLTQMVPVLTQRSHFQLSSDPEEGRAGCCKHFFHRQREPGSEQNRISFSLGNQGAHAGALIIFLLIHPLPGLARRNAMMNRPAQSLAAHFCIDDF